MLFEPLNSDGQKRSAVYHAERLSMLHDRLARKQQQIDHLADEVEKAAAALVDVTHGWAVDEFRDAVRSNYSAAFLRLDAGKTLGL